MSPWLAGALALLLSSGCEREPAENRPVPPAAAVTDPGTMETGQAVVVVAERASQPERPTAAAAPNGTRLAIPLTAAQPVLQLERVGGDELRAGERGEYSIRVTNVSDYPVSSVVVRQVLEPGLQIADSSVPGYEYAIGPEGHVRRVSDTRSQQSDPSAGSDNARMTGQQQPAVPSARDQGKHNQERDQSSASAQLADQQRSAGGQAARSPTTQDAQTRRTGAQQTTTNRAAQADTGSQGEQAVAGAQDRQQSDFQLHRGPAAAWSQDQQQAGTRSQGEQATAGSQDQQRTAAQRDGASQSGGRDAFAGQQQQSQPAQARLHSWTLGTLNPGESRTIDVTTVAEREGTYDACLTVDYAPVLCAPLEVVKPELRLQHVVLKDGRPARDVFICDEVTLAYRVTNVGSGRTTAGAITAELPGGLETAAGERGVRIPFPALAPQQSFDHQVRAVPTSTGEFASTATATTDKLEVQSNRVSFAIRQPDLKLTVDGPSEQYLARPVQYHIAVKNTSDFPALNTIVRLELPESARGVSASTAEWDAAEGTVALGTLEAGESRSFTVWFQNRAPGAITARVTAEAYCAKQLAQTIQTNVVGVPAIRLEAVDLRDPVPAGETTVYEVRVKNQGSAEDLNIQLSGQLPENFEFVRGMGDTDVSGDGRTVEFGSIERLPPNELATWRIEARSQNAGQGRFRIELTSDANPSKVIEQEPTTIF